MLGSLALLAGCATRPAEVRVAFDADTITASDVHGLADRTSRRAVTIDDPVRVASVSKLVVALGVMRLVEAGTLSLDRDVSDWLGWQFRNPAFPDKAVTLAMLLSHTSSLTDGADYALPLGGSVRATAADPRAWDADHAPGGYFRYTNFNFGVVASVMERATGERFDILMQRLVFRPLALDGCFNWSGCSDSVVARAVVLYDADGSVRRDDLGGARPDCLVQATGACDLSGYRPGDNGALFSPQGGARLSARDLARIGQMLLKRGDGFLSPASIAELERVRWTYDGRNGDTSNGFYCRYALAVQWIPTNREGCRDALFTDGRERFGHAGEAYGLRSGLWLDPASRTGVAFFATAVRDDAKGKRSAFTPQEERLAR